MWLESVSIVIGDQQQPQEYQDLCLQRGISRFFLWKMEWEKLAAILERQAMSTMDPAEQAALWQKLGVIYGDYPSMAEANAALQELPAALKAYGAYPRQVTKLR